MSTSLGRAFATLGLLAALALVPRSGGAQGAAQGAGASGDLTPDIETVGTGERRVPPDRATVMLLVESKAPAAAAAAAANARAVAAVRDTLRRLGLDGAATSASYNVGPDFEPPRPTDREGPRRVGYAARTVVRVQLQQIDQVGRVIDAGLARGATGVEGVFFEASTAEEARRAALADAAEAARRDAEALARALGGTLGPLLGASTAGGTDPRRLNVMLRGTMGYAGAGTEVTPNEIVIAAGVVTRWRFVPVQR
jgi:uncharacterized protein